MENDLMVISTPTRDATEGSTEGQWGFCEKQGERSNQEDALVLHTLPEGSNPFLNFTKKEIGDCLNESLAKLDQKAPKNSKDSNEPVGSTVSTTIWTGTHLVTATLGDAVAFVAVYRGNQVLGVTRLNSVIHSPDDEDEQNRIKALDSDVACRGGGLKKTLNKDTTDEVTHSIAVTRAIGDKVPVWYNKAREPIISSVAQIDTTNLDEVCNKLSISNSSDLKFQVITTCDGFTDGFTMKAKKDNPGKTISARKVEHEDYLFEKLKANEGKNLDEKKLAEDLANEALKDGSTDNISVAVKTLDRTTPLPFLVGVFDGHGGNEVSHYLAHQFCPTFYATCFIEAVKKELNDAPISPKVLTVINKSLEDILKLAYSPNNLNNEQFQKSLDEKKAIFLRELDKLNWPLPQFLKNIFDIFFSCAGYQTFKARDEELSKVLSEIDKLHKIVEAHHQAPTIGKKDEKDEEAPFIEGLNKFRK